MSKLIKPDFYIPVDDAKTVEYVRRPVVPSKEDNEDRDRLDGLRDEIEQALLQKEQVLRDAETMAEQRLQQAMEEADELRESANREIESWWNDRRAQDEAAAAAERERGYGEGFDAGQTAAEQAVREQYAGMLEQAGSILQQAYVLKQRIIQEAEPFLIELSCAIAEKIIRRQLTLEPSWAVTMTREVLARKREKGLITLCVSPEHFAHLQEARDELLLAVDSQAELAIVPDMTVADHGCVVRSAYGNIDARVDTQLTEIKTALQQIALQGDTEPEGDQHA